MSDIEETLRSGDALLIVDVQKDFCSGGALPIEDGEKVIPILNRWIAAAVTKGVPIYASRIRILWDTSVSKSLVVPGHLTAFKIAMVLASIRI